MIFRSFGYLLRFPELYLIQKILYCVSIDVSVTSASQQGLVRVKPDQWGPLVSDPVHPRVNDRWVRSTHTSDAWVPPGFKLT